MPNSYVNSTGLKKLFSLIKTGLAGKADTDHVHNAITTAGTGAAYTVTVPGVTALTAGLSFIINPHTASTATAPTLNLNGLGAKAIRRRLSLGTSTTVAGSSASWLSANKPVHVTYDGTYWIADNIPKTAATDIYGAVPISGGGTGASDGATGLANLFAAGETVLSSYQYGEELPAAGTEGRIFFKKGNFIQSVLQSVYPVGSMYISTVSTSPATLFGFGTWERVKDVFLLAAGDTYAAGATGGEATHTLTVNEMPAHRHGGYVQDSAGTVTAPQWATWVKSGCWGQVQSSGGERGYWNVNWDNGSAVGGGAAHNNMPPYLAVYMWRRTA